MEFLVGVLQETFTEIWISDLSCHPGNDGFRCGKALCCLVVKSELSQILCGYYVELPERWAYPQSFCLGYAEPGGGKCCVRALVVNARSD